jgi:hypothetical protein
LLRTDTAIADCKEHFAQCDTHFAAPASMNPAIIAYLARHIAVLLCAEIEIVITKMVFARVDACGDPAVAQFVKSVRGNIVRNAKHAEIGKKLLLLGDECGERYETEVNARIGPEGIAKLGMAVGTRDESAHSAPPNITFGELEEAYRVAEQIIESVRIALGLPADVELEV